MKRRHNNWAIKITNRSIANLTDIVNSHNRIISRLLERVYALESNNEEHDGS